MGKTIPLYMRCRTCGKYIAVSQSIENRFCSDSCARVFTACENCGKYFEKEQGYRQRYCSRDCSVHFKLNRVYGPEPVMVIVEE